MLLHDTGVPRLNRRGPLERLRVAIAHLLYGRVVMLGDRRAAVAAMGAFYARTSESRDAYPSDLDAAVDVLTAGRPEEGERLLLAALRIGSAVVHLARDAADVRDERASALRRLEERTLDRRLVALLSE